MTLLIILAIGPFVLGAKLLGASWLLAVFIGLVVYPALAASIAAILFALDMRKVRLNRKQFAERQRQRDFERYTMRENRR